MKKDIAFGAGAALGIVFRVAINLGVVWLNLWLLTQFGWLPF